MSRASRRSATPNACPRMTRQRSWEERCRRSTSGSHERKQHTAGGARRTGGARHRAQGVRLARRSQDHRSGRLRLLRDRPRARRVRHGNDRESGELVSGHERLGHRADPQVVRASNSRHPGSGDHGHPGVRGGNRRRGARDRPPGEVSADRQPGHLRPGTAHRIQELRTGPRHRIRAMGQREHHHIPVDRVARRPGECREDCGGRRHRHDRVWAFRSERAAWGPPRPRAPEIQSGGASDRGGMQCTRQTCSGIGGDRGADRGILAARMQGAELAGERREHVSRRNESARGPCTCAVEVDWGADPMRGSGGLADHPYYHAVTLLPCCHEHAYRRTSMTKYLHTMIRVSSLEDTIAFFEVLGLREIRRRPDEKGRYTNVFLAAPGDEEAAVELTYNWDPEPYTGGRNFGHLAYAVGNIYDTCSAFIAHGVTINRPPRDGRVAFIRTPDGISLELLQAGDALPPAEPWTSMGNTGSW